MFASPSTPHSSIVPSPHHHHHSLTWSLSSGRTVGCRLIPPRGGLITDDGGSQTNATRCPLLYLHRVCFASFVVSCDSFALCSSSIPLFLTLFSYVLSSQLSRLLFSSSFPLPHSAPFPSAPQVLVLYVYVGQCACGALAPL